MQFSFPFAQEKPAQDPSVWVVACLDKPTDWFARSIERFRHVFVHADDGSSIIGKNDTIILRDRFNGRCRAYGPDDVGSGCEVPTALDIPIAASRDSSVHRLVAIFLGYEARGAAVPNRYSTPLERTLATLRHPIFDETPMTRLARSSETRTSLCEMADETLLAVLDRESADAARAMYDVRSAMASDIDMTHSLHRNAARQLRRAGMPIGAGRAEKAFQYWMSRLEPTFPFPEFERPIHTHRIGYRCVSVLARRIDVNSSVAKPIDGAVPAKRKQAEAIRVNTSALCAWLGKTEPGKVAAWHEWEDVTGDPATLKIGVDDRLSVELGLAGRTGLKESVYNVRLWGDGCEILPATAKLTLGDALTTSVKTFLGCKGTVEVLFIGANGRQMGLKLKAPMHALEQIVQRRA